MKWNSPGWSAAVSVALLTAFAPAAFAVGGDDGLDEGQTHNGLSSKAFRRNALTTNKEALEKLLAHPLNDELFLRDDAYLGRQLRDPKAMAVMEELVACALDPKTEVTAKDPSGNVIGKWRGELGLCQGWHTRALKESEQCQQLVTACLMARVNAVGKSVPLSLRSEQGVLSPPHDPVLTETRFRESPQGEDPSEGWLIPSFARTKCRGPECNWVPGHVGTCVPGEEIQLAIAEPSTCEATGLRACAGIHGCVGPTVTQLPNGAPLPSYSRHLGTQQGACKRAPLSFTCPTDATTAGYYSVMIRPQQRPGQGPPRPRTVAQLKGSGTYPAPEKDVFTFPEGAFYGNLFQPERLSLSCRMTDATPILVCTGGKKSICNIDPGGDPIGTCDEDLTSLPYRNVYACFTYAQVKDDDESSVAALNKRLCDSPDAKVECFPNPPQRCHFKDPGVNQQRGAHCDAMGKDGAFGSCLSQVDDTTRYEWIITTYLNEPCDFLDEGSLCNTMRSEAPPRAASAASVPKVAPGPRGCGCSLDGSGGALPPIALAAVVALLLRRRARRRAG